MSRQRFVVFIIAIIGLIATFLPWYQIGNWGSVSGLSSSGWFTFIMFIIVLFLGLRGDQRANMSNRNVWLLSIFSIVASIVVIWRMFDIYFSRDTTITLGGNMGNLTGNEVFIRYGAWLVVIAGICIPFAAFLFKGRKMTKN